MNKKISILLFFVLVLMSISAVSAADADGNNDTIVSSADAGTLALACDVDAIDDLDGNYSDGDTKALSSDAKSVAVGKNKEIYSGEGNVLREGDVAGFTEFKNEIETGKASGYVLLSHKNYKFDDGQSISLAGFSCTIDGNGATIDMNGQDFCLFSGYYDTTNVIIKNLIIKNRNARNDGVINFEAEAHCSIINCTFENNTAWDCGAIIGMRSIFTITDCTFVNNTGEISGAIYAEDAKCTITGCTFVNNTGRMAGAIMMGYASQDSKVENCAFANNSAKSGHRAIDSGSIPIDDNWWGSNNPNWQELIEGQEPSNYAVLSGSANTTTIATGSKAKLNYAFYRQQSDYLLSISARPIELSSTGGQLDDTSGYLINGEFSTEFSSNTPGTYVITAIVDNQEIELTVTVTGSEPKTIYVNATANQGGDGNQTTPFQTLQDALDIAGDGDTIMIASGTYTGENNTELTIDKKLSFEKYGDGEAIIDAQKQNGIFTVTAGTINITGLTFKNGKKTGNTITGGAIYIGNALSDSIINATFIDNTVVGGNNLGGAIYFENAVNNVKIYGEFINNTADLTQNSFGGAIAFHDAASNSIINATFIDNSAGLYGGALYSEGNTFSNVEIYGEFSNNKATRQSSLGGAISFRGTVSNSVINATFIDNTADTGAAIHFRGTSFFPNPITNLDITGKFINNTGKYVIDVYSAGSGNEIHDAVFLNNAANKIINIGSGSVYASDNWFGNNATNYNETPANVGIDLDNWLFLNATANPSELELNKSSTVAFKLYNKNSPDVEYDALKMNIVLDLAQTLGELDKDTALIGEEISYTAKDAGAAGVTGKFETASYTVSLKNVILTNITLENTTFDLKVNDEVSSGATLTPADAGILTYTSNNESVVIVENGIIKAVGEGTANVTVSFAGDDVYAAAENKTISVTVSLNEAVWYYILQDVRRELDGSQLLLPFGVYNCLVVNSTDQPLPKGLNVTIKLDDAYTLNSTVGDDGIFEVDVNGITPKFYTVTFSSYGYTSAVATVLIVKKPTSIALENETMVLKVNDNVSSGATLNPAEAGNLTYTSSNSTVAIVENGEIKALAKGTANITVTFGGNDEYAAAKNKTIAVTVSLNDANVTVNNDTLDLLVGDEFTLVAETVPAGLDVNFTSTDPSVVAVDADGKVTAVGNGTATIVVSVGDDKVYAINTTSVAVTVKIPTEINITNSSVELYVGGNGDITWANLIPTEAGSLKYSSNDTSVMWVSTSGGFQTNSEGTALITVSFAGDENYAAAENKTITVTVIKYPTEIILANATMDLNVNDEVPSGATLEPSWAGELNYTSSNESVVIVRNGMIKAVGEGTANVTVSFAGNYVIADAENKTISVTVSLNDASVSVNNDTLDLFVDDNFTIVATTVPANLNVTYVPDNSGVVSIDEKGIVTALKEGTTSIIVRVGGDGVYAENSTAVAVTVSKIPTKLNVTVNYPQAYDSLRNFLVTGQVINVGTETRVKKGSVDIYLNNEFKSTVNVDNESSFRCDLGPLDAGTYELYAEYYDKTGKFNESYWIESYTITPANTTIDVTESSIELIVDEDANIVAVLSPSDAGNLSYSSNDSAVAGVDEYGNVTAVGAGTATITVSFAGNKNYAAAENKTVTVTVSKIPTEITIANATLDLKVLNLTSAGATLNPAEAGNLTYNSSNSSVAMVFGGVIIPVGQGNAIITVSFNGTDKYAAAEDKTISVTVGLNDVSLSVNNSTLDLNVRDTFAINVTTVPEIAKIFYLNYTSSNESVVIVDENGTVTAVGKGNAIITVEVGDGRVFAKNSTEIAVSVDKIDISDKIVIEGSTVTYGENAIVTVELPDDAKGNVTVTINNKTYTEEVEGRFTVVEIPDLAVGLYELFDVTYSGDDRYYGTSGMATVEVNCASSSVIIRYIDDPVYPGNVTIRYSVKNATTVWILVLKDDFTVVANETVVANVSEFNNKITIDGLKVGHYNVGIYNFGDANYTASYDYANFAVNKADPFMKTNITEDIWVYDENVTIDVVLPEDATGKVMLVIDSEPVSQMGYNLTNGTVSIPVPSDVLTQGRHSYVVFYDGDENYNDIASYATFEVTDKDSSSCYIRPIGALSYPGEVNISYTVYNATEVTIFVVDDHMSLVFNKTTVTNTSVFDDEISLEGLSAGQYIVFVRNEETDTVTFSYDLALFKVDKALPVMETEITHDIEVLDENVTVKVVLPSDATGEVAILFDGELISQMGYKLVNGTVSIPIPSDLLTPGRHSYAVSYSGDGNYEITSDYDSFVVNDKYSSVCIITYIDDLVYPGEAIINYTVLNATEVRVVVVKDDDNSTVILNKTIDANKSVFNDTIELEGLASGQYIVIVYNMETDTVKYSLDFFDFFVVKALPIMEAEITPDIKVYTENVTVKVVLPSDATGEVMLLVDDEPVSQMGYNLTNGTAVIPVPSDMLTPGLHSYFASYMGDDNYEYDYTYATFEVADKNKSYCIIMPVGNAVYPGEVTIDYFVGNATTVTIVVMGENSGFVFNKTTVSNESAFRDSVTVSGLAADEYLIIVTNIGTETVVYSNDLEEFVIYKAEPVMETSIPENITAGDEGVDIHVVLPENATGRLMVEIDGESINQMGYVLINGTADINIPPDFLNYGEHSYMVSYDGDDNYTAAVSYQSFYVDALKAKISVDSPVAVIVGDDVNVTVFVENATGFVALYLDDNYVNMSDLDANGTASFVVKDIAARVHYFTVIYSGDDKFEKAFMNFEINVMKEFPIISVDCPVTATVGDDVNVTVFVEDATGFVIIYFDDYYVCRVDLDENGTASFVVEDIISGDHYFTAIYSGDSNLENSFTNWAISVEKETTEANITLPVDFKIGEEANVTVEIPGATGNVTLIIDGVETTVPLDENGTAVVPFNVTGGEHSVVVVYSGDEEHSPIVKTDTFYAEELDSEFTNLTVSDDLVVTGVLVNSMGDPIANATIAYVVGSNSGNLTTGNDGSFTIAGESNAVLSVNYAGTDYIVGSNFAIKFGNLESARLASEFNVTEGISIKTYAVDSKAGEVGQTTSFRLTDSNGNPIVNATVKFAYKTVILERTTDENGIVFIGINTQIAQEALCALSYLGDEKHNATFVAFSFDIQKKPITISASAKSYNANAKTKKYTVTLKTEKYNSRDGKVYLNAGKKVTLKINGKTYTAKTNSKGQATFSLKITKKGNFIAKINFAGDKTYASASKKVKITIK